MDTPWLKDVSDGEGWKVELECRQVQITWVLGAHGLGPGDFLGWQWEAFAELCGGSDVICLHFTYCEVAGGETRDLEYVLEAVSIGLSCAGTQG